jgi:hypothetical protein
MGECSSVGVKVCPDSSARICSGKGETPQIADAQGGSGGVGIRELLPWVLAEPPVIHVPL